MSRTIQEQLQEQRAREQAEQNNWKAESKRMKDEQARRDQAEYGIEEENEQI
jgi:hypothetical protein